MNGMSKIKIDTNDISFSNLTSIELLSDNNDLKFTFGISSLTCI